VLHSELKYFVWDWGKNQKLKAERGVSFEEIIFGIENGLLLDILEHPNRERHEGQRIFVVRLQDYVYLLPFLEEEHQVMLKSIIPSRKATTEKQLVDSVERGEWRSLPELKSERKRYLRYAAATFRKDRRVNIRISSKDLDAIQTRALEEGLPYQTLISSLLHKYVSGRLRET